MTSTKSTHATIWLGRTAKDLLVRIGDEYHVPYSHILMALLPKLTEGRVRQVASELRREMDKEKAVASIDSVASSPLSDEVLSLLKQVASDLAEVKQRVLFVEGELGLNGMPESVS